MLNIQSNSFAHRIGFKFPATQIVKQRLIEIHDKRRAIETHQLNRL
jgi:hypothetical protein